MCGETMMSTRTFYTLETGFYQVSTNCQVLCQTVGEMFSMLLPKIKDANWVWQTVGDALRIINFAMNLDI
jgi:hypothetical protein